MGGVIEHGAGGDEGRSGARREMRKVAMRARSPPR